MSVDAPAPGAKPSTEAQAQGEPAPAPAARPPPPPSRLADAPAPIRAAPAAPTPATPAPPAPNLAGESRATTYGGPAAAGDKDWVFDFHGYVRAPMRVGIGERTSPAAGQGGTTFHRPIVPDDQYLSWQYTGRGSDWAELFLSVGNPIVKGTVAITGYQFSDAAWVNTDAQFGIALGYLTLRPDLPWKNVRVEAVVGSHWNRYGQAGKYDSGKYDTFVFGRTHVLGYRLRGEIDISDITLWAEQGFGTHRPNPSIYNSARFTLLNHGHAGLTYGPFSVGLHYLHSYAAEESRDGAAAVNGITANPDNQPDGKLDVFGPEARLEGGPAGDLYLAYSHISASHAATVSSAIEVLHSQGGGEFTLGVMSNYLDAPRASGDTTTPSSQGNGSVDTVAGQYEFHVGRVVKSLAPQDFTLYLFGMLNHVKSDDPNLDGDPSTPKSSINKVKYGVDGVADILPWLGAAIRFDRVQPNSAIPERSFSTIYPRVLFRTSFVTHELISFGYTRYFYNSRSCDTASDPTGGRCAQAPAAPFLPEGFGATAANQTANTRGAPGFAGGAQLPDKGVVTLEASMWW